MGVLFIIAWLVSPIVLGIILGIKVRDLKKFRQQLQANEQIISEYRMQNDALKNALRLERAQHADRPITGETVQVSAVQADGAIQTETPQTTVVPQQVETPQTMVVPQKSDVDIPQTTIVSQQFETPQTTFVSQQAETPQITVVPQQVEVPQHAKSAIELIREATVGKVKESNLVDPSCYSNIMTTPQMVAGQGESKQPLRREKRPKREISSGVVLFGIGILLIFTAGIIFATTSWNNLSAAGRVAVLLGTVALFYGSAFIAEKKLKLKNTSITFFILGSTFLAVSNVAAGYYGLYGFYDTQKQLVWAISFMLAAMCMVAGKLLYRTRFFAFLAYILLLLAAFTFANHICDNNVEIAVIMGFVLLWTKAYTVLVERKFEEHPIALSLNIFQYIYCAIVLCIAFAVENNLFWGVDKVALSMKITLWAMVTINLALSLWNVYNREKIKKLSLVFVCVALIAFGQADRTAELFTTRLFISLVLFIILEVILLLLKIKNSELYRPSLLRIVGGFADVFMMLAAFGTIFNEYRDYNVLYGIVAIVLAIMQYAIRHISEDNISAFLTALALYIGIIDVAVNLDVSDSAVIALVLSAVVVAVALFVGRLLYKKLVIKVENGVKLDWLSIFAPVMLIFSLEVATSNEVDAAAFITALVFSAYLASYYGRCNGLVDNAMLTLSASSAMFFIGVQPFYDIPKELVAEWWIAINIIGTAICAVIWRKYKSVYVYVWMVAIGTAFLGEFFSISDYLYRDEAIGTLKLVIYLVGVLGLFVFAYMTKRRRLLVEIGFAFVLISFHAWSFDAKGIFIISALLGLAYLAYLHWVKMSVWAFLPLAQLYIVLGALDMPRVAWLFVFAIVIIAGYVLHFIWDKENEKSYADDMVNISGIIPILVIFYGMEDKWTFCSEMMLVIYLFSFYKRYKTDKDDSLNKGILAAATCVMGLAWITQPWFEIDSLWRAEWSIVGLMGVCVVNMLLVYKHSTYETWGWITFAMAVVCTWLQASQAIAGGEVIDALILGVVMLGVLVWAFITKKKQWFILAAATLVGQTIYASREFWRSLAWWVYLLMAGAILIVIAARSEYKKRFSNEEDSSEKHRLFQDWSL